MNHMQPLSHSVRTRVLWFLFFLFLITTPILIGYSKGYRMNDAFDVIQTGGIFLHSDIANTAVYLDNKFMESNGVLTKNTLIQNLLPNRYYTMRVEREGFQSWVKVLYVKPKLVTEARVLMLPTTFDWSIIAASTTIKTIDEHNKEVSTTVSNREYEKMKKFFENDVGQFEVEIEVVSSTTATSSSAQSNKKNQKATTTIIREKKFPDWLQDIASSTDLVHKDIVTERDGIVAWLEHGDLFAVWGRKHDQVPYYFCAETCVERFSINWAEPILYYEFYPNRSDVVVVLSERGLYVVELDNRSERNLQTIIEEPNLDFRFLLDGTLVVYDGEVFRETKW